MGSDTAHVSLGVQSDFRKLFFSEEKTALVIPVTLTPGCGVLKAGQTLALNGSTAGNADKYMPYSQAAKTGAEEAPGRAYLVVDADATTDIYVTLDDSRKFVVGDELYILDDNTAAKSLGAITAIDRTTYTNRAKITVTVAPGAATFLTSDFAFVVIKGYDTATGVLAKSVDTGTGSTAKGAVAPMIISNAILYNGMLVGMDSAARTDLSASVVGQFLVIK